MSQADLSRLSPEMTEILLNGPALALPPGTAAPALANPDNGSDLTRSVVGLGLAISSILVLVRLCASWGSFRNLRISDFLLILSFGSYVAYVCVVLDSTNHVGFLIHQWDIRLKDKIHMLRNFNIGSSIYASSMLFIKAAILLEWLCTFNPTGAHNSFYWTSHTILWGHLIFNAISIIVFNLACRPLEKSWDSFVQGTCYDARPIYVASTAIYLVVDVCILLLHQKVIWGLQMSMKKKLGVALIFMTGILAIASVGARLVMTIYFVTSVDEVYYLSSLGVLVIAEMTAGIIIFCMPSVPKMVSRLNPTGTLSSLCFWGHTRRDRVQVPTFRAQWPSVTRESTDFRDGQDIERLGLTPLLILQSKRSAESQSSKSPYLPQNAELAILRTTVITAISDEDNSSEFADHQFNRQHPWNPTSGV
ncbi:hypothetical protein F5X99DRAFT_430303 [Biscogniauxia marginata]|nr:hypothetical protein F5X99DRAFT_430303 [Biscogniauxia marginata]